MNLRQRIASGLGWTKRPAWKEVCAVGAPIRDDRCAAQDCDSVSLTDLRPGERGTVSCLQHPGAQSAWKLAAMGVLPGTDLRLIQSYPAFIFRVGHAEFAIDEELAKHVRVYRL